MESYPKTVKSNSTKKNSRKVNLYNLLSWIPKGLSLSMIALWLAVLVIYGLGQYLVAGIMIAIILILTTLISWRNMPIGGCIFILLGSVYLVFSMGKLFSLLYVLASAPLFITGALFVLDYLYLEKKEDDGVDDF